MTELAQDNAVPVEGRWFRRHRQDWIAEMLLIYRFINRDHLIRKFEISLQQASYDLQQFQAERPGLMEYSPSRKRYEAIK